MGSAQFNKRIIMIALSLIAASLMLGPSSSGAGPQLFVTSPADGGFVTARSVVVEGCATAPERTLTLGTAELGRQPGTHMAWGPEGLVFRPDPCFQESFDGTELNTTLWNIIKVPESIHVANGSLVINNSKWFLPRGLVQSKGAIFSHDNDWTGEFKLSIDSTNFENFMGGGMTQDTLMFDKSVMAAIGMIDLKTSSISIRIYANGNVVWDEDFTTEWHVYKLYYSVRNDEFSILLDGEKVATFHSKTDPESFWFGQTPDDYQGAHHPNIMVDYAECWNVSGSWTSLPFDFGHTVGLDSIMTHWASNYPAIATADINYRTSDDNTTWTDWSPATSLGSGIPVSCRWLQLGAFATLDANDEAANVTISSFDVACHDPLLSVEVRRVGGPWVTATGLERWNATIDLVEDGNVLEVRALDTSGEYNTTSLSLIVDTIPPTGTMEIIHDLTRTNNLNVSLGLDAQDKYGVPYVEVSNDPNMFESTTFPYGPTVPWRLNGTYGEISVHVRFVDAHGLKGPILTDSVFYDDVPPTGALSIEGGAMYTTSSAVKLELNYSDVSGVASVELSNYANLSEARPVGLGTRRVDPWLLAGGPDGPRTVFMRMMDMAGNVVVVNASIQLVTPIAYGEVTIDGGALYTMKLTVSLHFETPPEMRVRDLEVSNEPSFEGAIWENLVEDKLWIVPLGDGLKRVYVRFEDYRGITSLPINATITLDTVPPEVTVTLAGGALYTTNESVDAHIGCIDASGPAWMRLSADERLDLAERVPFLPDFGWRIHALEGDHFLYIQVEDLAGNTAEASTSIHFAAQRPVLTLRLPAGTIWAAPGNISVEARVNDAYGGIEVQLAFGADPDVHATWVALNGSLVVPIPAGTPDGNHEVRARARNAAGLVSDIVTIGVKVDSMAPTVSIIHPVSGTMLRQSGLGVSLEFTAEDANGVRDASYSVDGGDWMVLGEGVRTAKIALDRTGDHSISVRASDPAGNMGIAITTFKVQKNAATVGGGGTLALVLGLLLIVVVCTIIAYIIVRRRGARTEAPKPREEQGH